MRILRCGTMLGGSSDFNDVDDVESITTCTDAYINLQASKIYSLISLLLENRMTVCMVKPTYVNYVKYTA